MKKKRKNFNKFKKIKEIFDTLIKINLIYYEKGLFKKYSKIVYLYTTFIQFSINLFNKYLNFKNFDFKYIDYYLKII